MTKRVPVIPLLFILFLVVFLPRHASAVSPQSIFIVHSYHQGFRWTDYVMAGMLEVFQREAPDAEIHVEYLDAKRFFPEMSAPLLAETLKRKIAKSKPQVILVSDDAAFDFLLPLRKEFFPQVPLVFCGVNSFKDERLAGQMAATGVVEDFDVKKTIEVILRLHKQTTYLAVISDSTETGVLNRERFRQVAPAFADRLKFLELFNLSTEELLQQLEALPPDAVILNLTFYRSRTGQTYSIRDSNRMIATHAGRPIYSCWDTELLGDVLGGYVTSGRQQGAAAAAMAAAILKGTPPHELPILRTSPNLYMFDSHVMERFGIRESALPEGSVVLNRPISLFARYWGWFVGTALFIGLQTCLIVASVKRGKSLQAVNAALQESEDRFTQLARQSRTVTWEVDSGGLYIFISDIVTDVLGYEPSEIVGKMHFYDLHPQEDREEFKEAAFAVFDKREPFRDLVNVLQSKTGEMHWISTSGIPLLDAEGNLLGYRGSGTEVTEQKMAEEAIKISESELRTITNAARDAIIKMDSRGRITFWNPAAEEIFGYSCSEALGENLHGLLMPERFELAHAAAFSEFIQSGVGAAIGKTIELAALRKDGKEVSVALSLSAMSIHGEWHAVGIIRDITQQKQADRALQESEERNRQIIHSSIDGFWRVDSQNRLVEVNDAYCRMSGYSREELLTMEVSDLDAVESSEDVTARVKRIAENGADRFTTSHRRKNGQVFEVEVSIQYRPVGDGCEFVVFLRDVTEKRQLESRLLHAQKLEAIGTLAGGIAHDFNNILGAVLGYAEIIRDDLPPHSSSIHDIDQVIIASHRAKDLVKQILAFSRQVEDQKIAIQPAVIVREAITLLRSSLPATITIKQDIDADAGTILGAPTQIHQVIMNLATNAFHAMEIKGGTLTITLQKKVFSEHDLTREADLQPGAYIQLSFRDTGVGITPEIRERIFDPFFTTKEVGKGTGLGLSMVYSIVKSCQGAIICESRMGEGTEFRIIFPALESWSSQKEAGAADLALQGKEHILFVDDEEMLVEMGQTMLERLGYLVTTKISSLDALVTFQERPDDFDLIITDQTMPGMTGIDLARSILQLRPRMPIILCTGYSSAITEDKAQALGIAGFALKPLSKKEIGEMIRKALDEKKS